MWKKSPKDTSLRESVLFEPSCVKIRRRVWPVAEFPKKGINKNNFGYISPICLAVWVADIITCDNFLVIGWGVSILWGSKIALSHWQSRWPLTQGWRYRAACDKCSRWAHFLVFDHVGARLVSHHKVSQQLSLTGADVIRPLTTTILVCHCCLQHLQVCNKFGVRSQPADSITVIQV